MSELATGVCDEAREQMAQSVSRTRSDFATVRTGRASPALVEKLVVDYYGTSVPLQQLAGFSVPDARMLVVQPFDKGAIDAISKALQESDLGINPSSDGNQLRLVFPPLTEDRRKELVKVVRQKAEDGRVSIRNHRRNARHDLDELERDKDISEDEKERFEKELDRATNDSIEELEEALKAKEQELLEI